MSHSHPTNHACEDCMQQISDCLDQKRALPAETLAHLESCEECQAFRQMWSADFGAMAKVASFPNEEWVASNFADKVMAARRTKQVGKPAAMGLPITCWQAIAASIALIAGLSIWSQRHRPGDGNATANISSNTPREDTSGSVDLKLNISEIKTDRLKEEISKAGTLGTVSLVQSGRGIGIITKEVRQLTTGFSKYFPTKQ
jgi:hypothetical protein